jgi:hypothetical protein
MEFIYNDGGRKDAGFKGNAGDCVCRSIAIITEKPYREVYDALNEISKPYQKICDEITDTFNEIDKKMGKKMGKCHAYKKLSSSRTGHIREVYGKYLKSLGYEWIPTMKIGTGCLVHLRSNELPAGRLIVSVSKHLTAMIDGIINDTWDCSREGSRCVYGYYIKKVGNSN